MTSVVASSADWKLGLVPVLLAALPGYGLTWACHLPFARDRPGGRAPPMCPGSRRVQYPVPMPAREATSLRRRPGTLRVLLVGSPTRSGVIQARRVVRTSRTSGRLSTDRC